MSGRRKILVAMYIVYAIIIVSGIGWCIREVIMRKDSAAAGNVSLPQQMTEAAEVPQELPSETTAQSQHAAEAGLQATQQTIPQATQVQQTTAQHTTQQTSANASSERYTDDSPLINGEYSPVGKAVSSKGSVTIRKAPDNSGRVAGWIPENAECEILIENVNGWVLVRYQGTVGFVYGTYLTVR